MPGKGLRFFMVTAAALGLGLALGVGTLGSGSAQGARPAPATAAGRGATTGRGTATAKGLTPPGDAEKMTNTQMLAHYLRQMNLAKAPALEEWAKIMERVPKEVPGSIPLALPVGKNHFVMSMCSDKAGNLWIATEGEGVFCYNPSKPAAEQWAQYTTKDGLIDNTFYAVACDNQGRIWLGTLNHGVSVFNGLTFANYEVVAGLTREGTLNGPLGEHVVKIAVAPETFPKSVDVPYFRDALTGKESKVAGSVWMASSAGLAVWFPSTDTWSYVTRAEGLPSDQANAICFDPNGTVYVGTQCDGIAMGKPGDKYGSWKQVTAAKPEPHAVDGKIVESPVPVVGKGKGLPSDLINDLLMGKDGTVYAATTLGLAWSGDHGNSWQYVRGADWVDKVKGRIGGPPKDWKAPAKGEDGGGILTEDYCTALAEDKDGNVLIGHRAAGSDLVAPKAVKKVSGGDNLYVMDWVSVPGAKNAYRGTYGEGVSIHNVDKGAAVKLATQAATTTALAKLPSGASVLEARQIEALKTRLAPSSASSQTTPSPVMLLAPDWSTQGAWLGRIGKYWMAHAAAVAPTDLYWGLGATNVEYHVGLGSGAPKDDTLRYWIASNHTKDNRSLELTMPYLQSRVEQHLTTWDVDRRQSGWDDHGEATPESKEGPGLYFTVKVPKGNFVLSLYAVLYRYSAYGSDTSRAETRRDFVLSACEHPTNVPILDCDAFHKWPELARARVVCHAGGVYTRFFVQGPRSVSIYVDRNYSFNTIINGAFLDDLEAGASGYFRGGGGLGGVGGGTSVDGDVSAGSLGMLKVGYPGAYVTASRQVDVLSARLSSSRRVDRTESALAFADSLYKLNAFSKWEEVLHETGKKTPREIEKMLRWDGRPNLTSDMNSDLVKRIVLEPD